MPLDFMALAQQCAPHVAPATLAAIVRTESGFNPYAIGVVHGRLMRQPRSLGEAVASARNLESQGWNYSVGLAQVNRANFMHHGLTFATAFDPCRNLAAGAAILRQCFEAAQARKLENQQALRAGLSCYASGNFVTGYRTGYVQRVVDNAREKFIPPVLAITPDIDPIPVVPEVKDRSTSSRMTAVSAEADQPDRKTKRAASEASAVVF